MKPLSEAWKRERVYAYIPNPNEDTLLIRETSFLRTGTETFNFLFYQLLVHVLYSTSTVPTIPFSICFDFEK